MKNTPQAVTERYMSNLLRDGTNHEFNLETLERKVNIVDTFVVGAYFLVAVSSIEKLEDAVGATPAQALRRALEKHGVTFR